MHAICLIATVLTVNAPAADAKPTFPDLPDAVSSFGAVVLDGSVYTYGGHTGKAHQYSTETVTGKFRRLNLATPEKGWEELTSGTGLQGLALVVHGGKIYRIGGMQPRNKPGEKADNHSVSTCAVFDPKTAAWNDLPELPKGRSSHDATVVGDKIVVAGGWCLKGQGEKPEWHDTALILDLAAKEPRWESVPQPFQRRALNMAAVNGKAYVVCGMTPDGELELGVNVFDPATKKWSEAANAPLPLNNGFTPAACCCKGKLLVNPRDGNLYRLTDQGDSWELVGKVDTPRFVHRMVPIADDQVLILGGASPKGNVAVLESITVDCCGKPVSNKAKSPPGEQAYCPIMRGIPVGNEATEVEYEGVKIKLCCSSCLRRWKAEPEAYLDLDILPQLKGKELPQRGLEQLFCPVYRDRVVSSKDPWIEHQGKKIYFFNESAKKKFQADPEKYLQ